MIIQALKSTTLKQVKEFLMMNLFLMPALQKFQKREELL